MEKSFKQRCIELRLKDCTLDEIVEITGRSKTSVYFHIKDIPLSQKKKKEISNKARVQALKNADTRKGVAKRPYTPFTVWTPDTVLLVSHLMFDGGGKKGCVYDNRSKSLVDRVERLMKQIYKYPPRYYQNKETGVYRISYHNVALASFVQKKKKELLLVIEKLPKKCQREFIRAFFDDEGCMSVDRGGSRRRIRGYQKSKTVLKCIKRLLQHFSIESKLQGKNEVVITGKENLKRFQKEINFSEGVRINPNRTNSRWKKNLEKRKLLEKAIDSYIK